MLRLGSKTVVSLRVGWNGFRRSDQFAVDLKVPEGVCTGDVQI
jgi:hypothetical protein